MAKTTSRKPERKTKPKKSTARSASSKTSRTPLPAMKPKATATKPKKTSTKKPARHVATTKRPSVQKIVKRTVAAAPAEVKTEQKQKMTLREKKIQDIRKMLLDQKLTLLSEAEEALNTLPGQTIYPDLGDQASAEIDRNFMLRLRGREQRLIKKIEESIEKIESGSFGVCEVCGQNIDIKRLQARPVTTMCIECKIEQEEEERLRG